MDSNRAWLQTRSQAPSQKGTSGSILGIEQVRDLLGLTQAQTDEIAKLEAKWGQKLDELKSELVDYEVSWIITYEKDLKNVLDREQRRLYQNLVGSHDHVQSSFGTISRVKNSKESPGLQPRVTLPPTKPILLDAKLVDQTAISLLLSKQVQDDLQLSPQQQSNSEQIRIELERAIKPLSLEHVIQILNSSKSMVNLMEQNTRPRDTNDLDQKNDQRKMGLSEAQNLAKTACGEVFELLTEHQQLVLEQITLQHLIGASGTKFPLCCSYVQDQVQLRIDQKNKLKIYSAPMTRSLMNWKRIFLAGSTRFAKRHIAKL